MYRHDVFWGNMVRGDKKIPIHRLGFLDRLTITSKLKHLEKPFIIYTGNSKIIKLEKWELNPKVIHRLNKTGLDIYLYEPLCYRAGKNHNRSFYSEFNNSAELGSIQVDEFDSIEIFIKKNKLTSVKIFTCDYNIQKLQNNYPNLNLNCLDIFIRTVPFQGGFRSYPNTINKKFWCGNWRYTVHRHIIAAYLATKDANLSWNLKCSFNKLTDIEWIDLSTLDSKYLDKLIHGSDYLFKNTVSIDVEMPAVGVDSHKDVYIPSDNAPGTGPEFLKSYKECFCAVINETRFAQPCGNISEKVLYAINAKMPFILVAPPHSLEYMKKLGFKTFDKFWDESYDQEDDHQTRLLKILDLIDYIDTKSIHELTTMYSDMQETIEHNLLVLSKIASDFTVL